jgi:DNA-binding MarR family transcriptional regulator
VGAKVKDTPIGTLRSQHAWLAAGLRHGAPAAASQSTPLARACTQPRAPEDYQLLRVYAVSGAYCRPASTLDAREIFIFGGCVAQSVARAGRHITQFYDQFLAPSGLRTTQLSILAKLRRLGPMTINALAAAMVMDRTILGRNIPPLKRDGLIAVEQGSRDRRSKELRVTEAGEARFRAGVKGGCKRSGSSRSRSARRAPPTCASSCTRSLRPSLERMPQLLIN